MRYAGGYHSIYHITIGFHATIDGYLPGRQQKDNERAATPVVTRQAGKHTTTIDSARVNQVYTSATHQRCAIVGGTGRKERRGEEEIAR